MKRIIIASVSLLIFVSCSPKEEHIEGELSQSDIANMEETSEINIEDIQYEGTFKGKINGKDIQLSLDGQSFELTENGKRAHGSWAKVNDGTIIELEPKGGSVSVKHYGYSDHDTWIALNDSLQVPEKEEFLKRIPD